MRGCQLSGKDQPRHRHQREKLASWAGQPLRTMALVRKNVRKNAAEDGLDPELDLAALKKLFCLSGLQFPHLENDRGVLSVPSC